MLFGRCVRGNENRVRGVPYICLSTNGCSGMKVRTCGEVRSWHLANSSAAQSEPLLGQEAPSSRTSPRASGPLMGSSTAQILLYDWDVHSSDGIVHDTNMTGVFYSRFSSFNTTLELPSPPFSTFSATPEPPCCLIAGFSYSRIEDGRTHR